MKLSLLSLIGLVATLSSRKLINIWPNTTILAVLYSSHGRCFLLYYELHFCLWFIAFPSETTFWCVRQGWKFEWSSKAQIQHKKGLISVWGCLVLQIVFCLKAQHLNVVRSFCHMRAIPLHSEAQTAFSFTHHSVFLKLMTFTPISINGSEVLRRTTSLITVNPKMYPIWQSLGNIVGWGSLQ